MRLKCFLDMLNMKSITYKDKLTDDEDGANCKSYIKESFIKPIHYTLLMRTIFSIVLIGYLFFTVYLGPFAIILTTLAIQVKCFFELIDIAYNMYETEKVPYYFRCTTWYFLIAANYFFYGENIMEYFYLFIEGVPFFRLLVLYHKFLSFLIYVAGVMWFVLSLKKKYDKWQFTLLAWTHVALLVLVSSSYMVMKNVFQGLIWLVISVTVVACNDTAAYLCGKIFGKRPLIKVSPKKTWEGFIGAGVITVISCFVISSVLCKYQYLICPIEYRNVSGVITMVTECERSSLFKPKRYSLDPINIAFTTYPFVLHTFWLSLFGSVIAPFGGFFASGFKRAFKVKDFGRAIPGHGGILDRFDCQIFMTTFVNVYISTFVKHPSTDKIFARILGMRNEHQIEFFKLYEDYLLKSGMSLNRTTVDLIRSS